MSKIIIGVVVVLLIVLGAYYLVVKEPVPVQPQNTIQEATASPQISPTSPAATNNENAATVEITDGGFSPAMITVKAGATVTFKNTGTGESWPASAKHPTHLVYPDQDSCFAGKFTGCGIPSGGSWAYTFNQKGSWAYHDHLRPTLFSKIVVE